MLEKAIAVAMTVHAGQLAIQWSFRDETYDEYEDDVLS